MSELWVMSIDVASESWLKKNFYSIQSVFILPILHQYANR